MGKRGYAARPLADRFAPKVQPNDHPDDPDACLIWIGGRQTENYGMIWSGAPENRVMLATHAALRIIGIEVPPGGAVLHSCDNPPCVNVRHLIVADRTANNRDMWDKGRSNWQRPTYRAKQGERVGTSRLTAESVTAMRQRYAAGGVTLQALADEYGVSISAVHQAIRRVRWAHVP